MRNFPLQDPGGSELVGNKSGLVFVIVVLVVVSLGFALMLNPPLVKHYTPPAVPSSGPAHYLNITLYADAQGWNYNHGTVDPTYNIANDTMVYFTVIEEDNQPHTLTINPGSTESSSSYADTLLGTSDVTTTPGHVSHAQMYFGELGVYTYWCVIHPTTMVGLIYVNNTVPSTSNNTTPSYAHYANQSLGLKNGSFYNGTEQLPTILAQNDTLLNFSVSDSSGSNYSLLVSPGTAVNSSSYSTVIGTTNTSAKGSIALNQTGYYTYWNGNNTTAHGQILVFSSLESTTLYANLHGWNYSQPSGANPALTFEAGALVNFTVINGDNLTHTLVIGSGGGVSANFTMVASVNSSENSSYGYFFFVTAGNYTYWDTYHPGTAVGPITVNSQAGSTSAAVQETYLADLTTE